MKVAQAPARYSLRLRLGAAGVIVVLACAVSVWVFCRPSQQNPKPAADVPLALISDYFEHRSEHAPPFQDGGVMQLRERYYQPPEDPFALLRSHLHPGNLNDAKVGARLALDEQRFATGTPFPPDEATAFGEAVAGSSIDAPTLLEAGRGFQFLVGDQFAAAIFRAALAKATLHFKNVGPGDIDTQRILHLLDQTGVLHRVNDRVALAERFKLAMLLYPPLSVESRRSACLCADALSVQGKNQEAADMILEAWRLDRQAGDLGLLSREDVPEMDWRAGTYLSAADRFADATEYYADYVRTGRDEQRKRQAVVLWALCLDRAGKNDQANQVRAKYHLPLRTAQSQASSRPGVQ